MQREAISPKGKQTQSQQSDSMYTCIEFIYVQVYGQGTAGDCRKHVQKLNMLRREQEALE